MKAAHTRLASLALALMLTASAPPAAANPNTPWLKLTGRDVAGLAVDSGVLWVTHAPHGDSDHCTILKLDAATGAWLGNSSQFAYNGRGICYALGSLWLVDAKNDRIHRLAPTDYHEISSFPTPGTEPSGITFDGTYLWLTDPWFQHTYQLTTTGTVVASFGIANVARSGLDWQGSGMWMPVDSTTVAHCTPAGAIDSTWVFPNLPAGAHLYDVATNGGMWFGSTGGEGIYLYDPSNPFVAWGGRQVCGLSADTGALWVTSMPIGDSDHAWITAVDPASGSMMYESPQENWNARGICFGVGSLWLSDAKSDVVRQLDPSDFHQISQFNTPGTEPGGIAFDGTYLWLADTWYRKVYQLTTSGIVVSSFPIPNMFRTGLHWFGGGVWMPTDTTTISHCTPTGIVDSTLTLSFVPRPYVVYDVAQGFGAWYASTGTNRIYRGSVGAWTALSLPGRQIRGVDAALGILWLTSMPSGGSDSAWITAVDALTGTVLRESAEPGWNARGICFGVGSLWLSDAKSDVVRQLDPSDFHQISQFNTPGTEPGGIAFDGTYLWLADTWYRKVYQLTTSGIVVSSFPIPNAYRTGLAWSDGGLWTPTAADTLSHYLVPSGTIDRTLAVPALPSGAAIEDLALTNGGLYVSLPAIGGLYVLPPETLPVAGVYDPVASTTLPVHPSLRMAGPNPVGPGTAIAFDLPRATRVTLDVLDVGGRVRMVLQDGMRATGTHLQPWRGLDAYGQLLASGVYFVRLRAEGAVVSRKVVLAH